MTEPMRRTPDRPFVSVIVPMYKVDAYIAECIDSIVDQSWSDFEIVLVDDGSPDRCAQIGQEYAARDPRVRVVRQQNQGLSAARNAGVRAALGRYLAFVDGDDVLGHRDALSDLASAADTDLDLVFGDMYRYYPDSAVEELIGHHWDLSPAIVINDELLHYMVRHEDVRPSASGKLIRRDFLVGNDLWFKPGIYSEDIEWFLRVLLAPSRSSYVPTKFYLYRQDRQGSITSAVGRQNIEDLLDTVTHAAKAAADERDERPQFSDDLLTYCCYQYTIALAHVGSLPRDQRRSLMPRVAALDYLLAWDSYGFSRKIRTIRRFAGLAVAARATGGLLRLRARLSAVRRRARSTKRKG